MHNPEFVLENETHKIPWYFEIETDHLIPARRPNQGITNKKKENLPNSRLSHPGKVKIKENENRDKYLNLARELKKP